ncbi:MAG: hypothetical protein M3R48_02635 [Candidatus Dormibacteraeota bacterium]|nr:hypothetical protein [Candidatus Dormibacteraeota bacterium]
MLLYIVVIMAAVVGLAASYRAFGGGQSRPADTLTLLVTAHHAAGSALDALDAVVTAGRSPASVPEQTRRSGPRMLAHAQHCIDMLPGERDLDADQRLARTGLMHAVDDLGWAWRIVATTTWADNEGLRTALSHLRDEAARCRDDVSPLLLALAPEPVEGPA